jgi:hypothetical protein
MSMVPYAVIENHRQVGQVLVAVLEHGHAVDGAHTQVGDDRVEMVLVEGLEGRRAVGHVVDVVAVGLELHRQHPTDAGLVLRHQDLLTSTEHGRTSTPSPGRLSPTPRETFYDSAARRAR